MGSSGALTSTPPDPLVRRLTIGFCLVALLLGAIETWLGRFFMANDGIQYLDNAAVYWRGDVHNALNTLWSPLYSWPVSYTHLDVYKRQSMETANPGLPAASAILRSTSASPREAAKACISPFDNGAKWNETARERMVASRS